jgi:3-hydroxyisobutyrate dehydrogenase-like beta-hydroxyacid dehydrogenase
MVGADAEMFTAVQPHLAHMGEPTRCGAVSFGQVVKALNNMVVFMTANALAEAITIGRRAGVDAKLLFETMAKGSSDMAPVLATFPKYPAPEEVIDLLPPTTELGYDKCRESGETAE